MSSSSDITLNDAIRDLNIEKKGDKDSETVVPQRKEATRLVTVSNSRHTGPGLTDKKQPLLKENTSLKEFKSLITGAKSHFYANLRSENPTMADVHHYRTFNKVGSITLNKEMHNNGDIGKILERCDHWESDFSRTHKMWLDYPRKGTKTGQTLQKRSALQRNILMAGEKRGDSREEAELAAIDWPRNKIGGTKIPPRSETTNVDRSYNKDK
jgi:hypothetical protein